MLKSLQKNPPTECGYYWLIYGDNLQHEAIVEITVNNCFSPYLKIIHIIHDINYQDSYLSYNTPYYLDNFDFEHALYEKLQTVDQTELEHRRKQHSKVYKLEQLEKLKKQTKDLENEIDNMR